MQAAEQKRPQAGGQLRTLHAICPGPMSSEPARGIQVLLMADLERAIAQDAPDGRGQSEDVGSCCRDSTQVTLGRQEAGVQSTGIEFRSRRDAGAESDQLDRSLGFQQDVIGGDSTMHDVTLMGMGQTVAGGHRRVENRHEIRFPEFVQIRTIHESGDQGDFSRPKTFSFSMDPQGRANGGVRQIGQNLVLSQDTFERAVVRRPAGVLEHHQVAAAGVGGQEDVSRRILPESGEDPESMLDVAGPNPRGFPGPTNARSHCCHVALHLDPDSMSGRPRAWSLTLKKRVDNPKAARDRHGGTGRAACDGENVPGGGYMRFQVTQTTS